jgi:hypothetical protein
MNLTSELLTYPLGSTPRIRTSDDGGDAISFVLWLYRQDILAVPDSGSHSRSASLDHIWLGVLRLRVRTKTCPLF